jgi:hypothetical protein
MKAWWLIVLTLTVLIGAGGWYLGRKAAVPPQSQSQEQLLGGDRDEHGCIGSAGYSWCELKQKCLRVWEEACAGPSDEETLKTDIMAAIVQKRGAVAQDMVISVNKVEGDYAQGGANSATPGIGGGMWFAARANGVWQLVWDGNGIITCDDLIPYPDFPTDMIPECYDDVTSAMVTR